MKFLLLMHVRTVKTIEGQVRQSSTKALMLLLRSEKGSSMSSEEHYANLPDPTHEDVFFFLECGRCRTVA